jgi:FecR protein
MSDEYLPPQATYGEHAPDGGARLHNLLEKICDQSANSDEANELNTLLVADRSARAYYLRYLSLHSSLLNFAGRQTESPSTDCFDCGTAVARPRPVLRWALWGLAAAAMLAAVLTSASLYWNKPTTTSSIAASDDGELHLPPDLSPVAKVTQLSDDIIWQRPNESIALHSHVSAGHVLQLARGEMRLTYGTGVELRLLGPAEFVVGSAGGKLVRGGVRAVVPKKGRGFTIETPNGKVVDLGTEFGVAVDDFGVSEVNVFQGMVDMFPALSSGAAETVRLTKGEAVQWNSEALVHLKADSVPFGGAVSLPTGKALDAGQLLISEDFKARGLNASDWRTLGDVKLDGGSLHMHNPDDPAKVPYLISAREFAPNNGPVTIIADIRFTDVDPTSVPSFAVLTRSAHQRDAGAPEGWRTMRTCVLCSFKSVPDSSSGMIEVATKLDRSCPLTNNLWRGFDQLERNVPYHLVMTDDGINVTFTVSLRDDPSVNKTVTCRSLFRGKENFVVFEGPASGTVAIDRIQLYQDVAAKAIAQSDSSEAVVPAGDLARKELIAKQLAALAPADASLVLSDDFDGKTIDANLWTTVDDVALIDGRVRLGAANAQEHINTFTSRPYLLTREQYAPADGALTIVGTAEFDTNFLNEYGGSFAVMTRADDQRGSGPGWEYSILQRGVRSNFWPAAWGQQHSLEIHEKPSPSSLSLLVAEGLEINPEAREYFFKIVDDGDRVALTIQDTRDATIKKTVSVKTNPVLRSGYIAFEGCWGCPVWLDNVRIYRAKSDQ